MASTAQHIAARGDSDLLARLIAVAEMNNIPSAPQWVQQNMGTLISLPIGEGQTIADVYAYAQETRQIEINALPPLPGLNPGAVTDAHMATAVTAMITPETPPANA